MKKATQYMAVLAALATAASVSAVPTLTLSDGINPALVITDGSGLDSNPAAGVVTYNGPYNAWIINVDTGITKPVLGSMTAPHLDLAYQTVGVGTLTINFSDDGFLYNGGLVDHFGGTTLSSVGSSSLNQVLVNGRILGSFTQGPYGPGAFSGTSSGQVSLGLQDVLAIQVTLQHSTLGNSSGNKDVMAVPEGGATLILLGSGLTVLGFLRRRMTKA